MTELTTPQPSLRPVASHFCGQQQPHAAHVWQTPPIYGQVTVISEYQCAGLLSPSAPEPTGEREGLR